jgi:hypothetical protein
MKIPGPGTYDANSVWKSDDQANKFDSMMRSDSVREFQQFNRGPGPAYYKLRQAQPKVNFNNNPSKKFL